MTLRAAVLLLAAAALLPAARAADEPVSPAAVAAAGGPAGAALAQHLGRTPVLLAYWRPGDDGSERALQRAAAFVGKRAPGVVLIPLAALATGQAPDDAAARLAALRVPGRPVVDDGRLGATLGVERVPSFVLFDAAGVARLVGGADVAQAGPNGATIADALVLASNRAPVPTLGQLKSPRALRNIGAPLPGFTVRTADGADRQISEFVKPGRRLLVVYWAASCTHCREALPKLAQWYANGRPPDVDVVDIARADLEPLARDAGPLTRGHPWTHLYDTDRSAGAALDVSETPTIYLVGPDRTVLAVQTGSAANWERMVRNPAP